MSADLYNVQVASGLIIDVGSHAVNLSLLCGLSGTSVIPISVSSTGRLITTSGA